MIYLLKISLSFACMLWNGFVFQILWKWFINSSFGLNNLTFVQATSIVLIVSFLVSRVSTADIQAALTIQNDKEKNFIHEFTFYFLMFLLSLIFLIFGWALRLFM